jgi:hypothetical protein
MKPLDLVIVHMRPLLAAPILATSLTLLALIALPACTHSVDIDPEDLETPTPLVERLPITVGVHYDDELLNHYHREEFRLGLHEHEYRLGPPTQVLFDPIFSAMFETVVPVDGLPSASAPEPNLSGVVSVSLEIFLAPNFDFPVGKPEGVFYPARIGYLIVLYSPQGQEISSFRTFGTSEDRAVAFEEAVVQAMRNAAAALAVSFYGNPEVMAWLASLGVSEHGAGETSQ